MLRSLVCLARRNRPHPPPRHHGFVIVDKPAGITSHDVVDEVRLALAQTAVGHSGTLDPAATGVLTLAVGNATKLLPLLPGGKAYEGTIRLGVVTDSDDATGAVIGEGDPSAVDAPAVAAALARLEGLIWQQPPVVSAVRVGGQRSYKRARSASSGGGGPVLPAPRQVRVDRIELLAWRDAAKEADVRVVCGAGTYIRSIARDVGRALRGPDGAPVGGTLAALRRTEANGFGLDQAVPPAQVAAASVLPPDLPFPLPDDGMERRHGPGGEFLGVFWRADGRKASNYVAVGV